MASLRDLGLSEYEERAYRSLLNTGPTTAKELSRASDVPMGRIYDVLNSIEQYNLVRSQTASRPKKYVAVEPATALERLLEDKKRALSEKADQYESIVEELSDELDAAEPVEEQFWTAAVGREESVDLLTERLTAADERIIMVAADPTPQFDLSYVGEQVADHLEDSLDRGVAVKMLVTPELVDGITGDLEVRYNEIIREHDACEIRTSTDVRGTFDIIDASEVCIQVPNPLTRDEALALIDLKDPEFATTVYDEFAPRWTEASELPLE